MKRGRDQGQCGYPCTAKRHSLGLRETAVWEVTLARLLDPISRTSCVDGKMLGWNTIRPFYR